MHHMLRKLTSVEHKALKDLLKDQVVTLSRELHSLSVAVTLSRELHSLSVVVTLSRELHSLSVAVTLSRELHSLSVANPEDHAYINPSLFCSNFAFKCANCVLH